MRVLIYTLLLLLPLTAFAQSGTSITLSGDISGTQLTRTFQFSESANGKNNYTDMDGQGVYWSTFSNQWIAAINEVGFTGITIGTSDLDSPNPPSFASGEWQGSGEDFITDLVGDGTLPGPFIFGCTDPTAINYDEEATIDDNSCIVNDCPDDYLYLDLGSCGAGILCKSIGSGTSHITNKFVGELGNTDIVVQYEPGQNAWYIYNSQPFAGLVPLFFSDIATAPNPPDFVLGNWQVTGSTMCQGIGVTLESLSGSVVGEIIYGCTDPYSSNYSATATVNDGSCLHTNDCNTSPNTMSTCSFMATIYITNPNDPFGPPISVEITADDCYDINGDNVADFGFNETYQYVILPSGSEGFIVTGAGDWHITDSATPIFQLAQPVLFGRMFFLLLDGEFGYFSYSYNTGINYMGSTSAEYVRTTTIEQCPEPICQAIVVNNIDTPDECSSATEREFIVSASCIICTDPLEYSIDNGTTWQSSASFTEPVGQSLTISVREENIDDCIAMEFFLVAPGQDICGCTDPTAVNYDANATVDDGSCSDLLCNSAPVPMSICTPPNANCYDIDGDGNYDFSHFPNSASITYPQETTHHSTSQVPRLLDLDSPSAQTTTGLSGGSWNPYMVLFEMIDGRTGYYTLAVGGTVSQMGITTSRSLTFMEVESCPSICNVVIAPIEVDPACPDATATTRTFELDAVCVSCSSGLEYSSDGGSTWQSNSEFELAFGTYIMQAHQSNGTGCTDSQELTLAAVPNSVVCGCTDSNADNYNDAATQDDGSCAGYLTCVENPSPMPTCPLDEVLPCYDIDGDGTADISIGKDFTLEAKYWGLTTTYLRQFSNPSTTFPLVVSNSDVYALSSGFQLECGNCSAIVVFVLESGVTAYLTATSDGTVTNMGLTNSETITFTGVNSCPTTCPIMIDNVEVENPICTDDLGSITVTATCEDCTEALEYKLDDGDWQDSEVFASLVSQDYVVYVREGAGGATECESSQSVVVEEANDTEAPTPQCSGISVELGEDDTYTLTDSDLSLLAGQSTDNCTAQQDLQITVSPNSFGCDDLGRNINVVVTVEDEAGNIAECDGVVGVVYNGPGFSYSIEAEGSLLEGNTGTTFMTFTITRNFSFCTGSVAYYTGGAMATQGVDFLEASGTLTFEAGEVSKTVDVEIIGDEELEPDEFFFLYLVSQTGPGAFGAGLSNGTRQGIILNDEITPNYEVNFMQYETLQQAIDALNGQTGTIFLIVDNYEDSSVSTIPSNVTLVVNQNRTVTFTNDIIVNGEIGSRGTIIGNLTINGKYFGGGSVDGNVTNNGVLMIGGNLPVQLNLNGSNSSTN